MTDEQAAHLRLAVQLVIATDFDERNRQVRHHDAVLMFVKARLDKAEPASGGEIASWAHLMADYLYPHPDAVFDPPLRHHRNPPPKAEGT